MFLLALALTLVAPATDSRPNILWITFEDCSPILGCDGNELARTPTLDRLASEGVRFTHAFSPSGVCAPSRAAIITGCYPTSIGAMHMRTGQRHEGAPETLPPSYEAVPPVGVRCFPELLRTAGYFCTNRSKTDYQFKAPPTVWDENGRKAHPEHRASGQPFFAIFNFASTHESRLFKKTSPEITDPKAVSVPPYLPDTPTVRQNLARQLDNLAKFDGQVKKLLGELDGKGLLENTIVFLFADHGSGIARGKRWVLDSGTRIPMIVRFPDGRHAGTARDRLVSFVDLAPTVLHLCGAETDATLQGRRFLGEGLPPAPDFLFAARDRTDRVPERIRSVRSARYRYVWNGMPELPHHPAVKYHLRVPMVAEIARLAEEGKLGDDQWQLWKPTKPQEELYDLASDPHEIHNLTGDPEHRAELERHRLALAAWQQEIGDLGLMDEREFFRTIWPDGKKPLTAEPTVSRIDGKLTVVCTTPGASIGWRLAGERGWRVYAGPLTLPEDSKIEAVAHRIGFERSAIVPSH